MTTNGRLEAVRAKLGHQTAGNAVWGVAVEFAQLILSSVLFFGLALLLDDDEIGRYGAILGIAIIAGNFSQVGGLTLLVKRVANGADESRTFSTTLYTILAGTAVLAVLVLGFVRPLFFDKVALGTFALLLWAQMPTYWVTEACVWLGMARRELRVSAFARLIYSAIRMFGLLAFAAFGDHTLAEWAVYAAVTSTIGVVLALAHTVRHCGLTLFWRPPNRIDLREGLPFTMNNATADVLDSADRILLVGYDFDADAGQYAVGYRIASMAWLPIMALVRATDADFFSAGGRSANEAVALAKKMTKFAAAYAIVAGVGLLVLSPMLSVVIGDKWDTAEQVVRILAILPLLKGLQVFAANSLTGSGRNDIRLTLLVVAMTMNVVLNIIVIPEHSWRGAIATTLISEVFLMVGLWVAATWMQRTQGEQGSEQR